MRYPYFGYFLVHENDVDAARAAVSDAIGFGAGDGWFQSTFEGASGTYYMSASALTEDQKERLEPAFNGIATAECLYLDADTGLAISCSCEEFEALEGTRATLSDVLSAMSLTATAEGEI